jgi:hypothetical protein
VRQPRIRSCLRRSRRLRPRSVEAQEKSDNSECHGLRGVRPLALGYSSDSVPNRCRPNEAIAFRGCAQPTIATQPQDHLSNGVGFFRQILCLQTLVIKSFDFEPPLTQRLRIAFWIASSV